MKNNEEKLQILWVQYAIFFFKAGSSLPLISVNRNLSGENDSKFGACNERTTYGI